MFDKNYSDKNISISNVLISTSFSSQRSLNITGSPAAVKMLTSPRMSLTLGDNSEAEALVTRRNLMEGNCFDEGTVTEEGEAKGDFKGNRDRNRRGD